MNLLKYLVSQNIIFIGSLKVLKVRGNFYMESGYSGVVISQRIIFLLKCILMIQMSIRSTNILVSGTKEGVVTSYVFIIYTI